MAISPASMAIALLAVLLPPLDVDDLAAEAINVSAI